MRLARTFLFRLALPLLLGACATHAPRSSPLIYSDDPYSKTIEINGTGVLEPMTGDQQLDWRLFTTVDRKTGAVTHELFIHSVSDGPHFTYTNAADDTAKPMDFRLEHRVNIVCKYRLVCGEDDQLAVPLTDAYLHAKAQSGFGVKVWANDNGWILTQVSSAMITDQFAAVARAEASLGRSGAPEPAPAPAPVIARSPAAPVLSDTAQSPLPSPNTPSQTLGVDYLPMNEMMLHQLKISEGYGMAVVRVTGGSPAAKAGLQVGDVLTKFDKTPLKTIPDLQQAVAKVPLRGKGTIEYWRGHERYTASVQF